MIQRDSEILSETMWWKKGEEQTNVTCKKSYENNFERIFEIRITCQVIVKERAENKEKKQMGE